MHEQPTSRRYAVDGMADHRYCGFLLQYDASQSLHNRTAEHLRSAEIQQNDIPARINDIEMQTNF
jgi:hypothetical protein